MLSQRNALLQQDIQIGFNGHPPLGVNATNCYRDGSEDVKKAFQWAPTLGGECY